VDRSVLAELPESIQAELRAAARRRKQAQLVTLAPSAQHAGKYAVGRKRKASSSAGSGSGSGTSHGAAGTTAAAAGSGATSSSSSDKPVQVLNIAAMFQQMEKRQKRQRQKVAAAATHASSNLTRPGFAIPPPVPAGNKATSTAMAPSRAAPMQTAASVTPPVASIVIDDEDATGQAEVSPVAAAAAVVAAVTPPAALGADSRGAAAAVTAGAVPSTLGPLPKGFARVDPRANPQRYAQAMHPAAGVIASVTAAAVHAAYAAGSAATLSAHAPNVDVLHPRSSLAAESALATAPVAGAAEDGVVAMDIDSDGEFSQAMVQQTMKREPDDGFFQAATAAVPAEPAQFASTDAAVAVVCLRPAAGQRMEDAAAPAVSAAAAAAQGDPSEDAEHGEDVEDENASLSFDPALLSSYISFDELQPWLSTWLQEVATPPRHSHVQLLQQWATAQLRIQHNLAAVQLTLQYLQRWARGASAVSWQPAFDHLLDHVQPVVVEVFGGTLALAPFEP